MEETKGKAKAASFLSHSGNGLVFLIKLYQTRGEN